MPNFYVNMNAQSTGEHEVHKEGCFWLIQAKNKKHLGNFSNCKLAIREAKKHYSNVDGCKHCIPECHTR